MRVIGTGRSTERCRRAEAEIRGSSGNPAVDFLEADLASLSDVRRLAEEIQRLVLRVDVLVNNAGTFTLTRRLTVDGLETQLAVNWLAPFLLTGPSPGVSIAGPTTGAW